VHDPAVLRKLLDHVVTASPGPSPARSPPELGAAAPWSDSRGRGGRGRSYAARRSRRGVIRA